MELQFKSATLDDIDLLLETRIEVLRAVFSLPPDEDTTALKEANRAYYNEKIPTGEHLAGFAYEGDQLVATGALCFYQEMPSPDNDMGMCAYLMNVYTRPLYRKRGIGNAMTDWLVEQARQRGVGKIYLETTPEGRRVYEQYGFVPMEDYLYLPL